MKNDNNDEESRVVLDPAENTVIKTGRSTYRFNQSWIENEALKDILVGLIADDYLHQDNMQ